MCQFLSSFYPRDKIIYVYCIYVYSQSISLSLKTLFPSITEISRTKIRQHVVIVYITSILRQLSVNLLSTMDTHTHNKFY